METPVLRIKVSSCGLTDIGSVRTNNEDVWAELKESVFVLADGMGGHQAGEVAARQAVDEFCKYVETDLKKKSISLQKAVEVVKQGIVQANSHVYKLSRSDHGLKGMGTTICCLYIHDEGVVYGHVGDSRIYRYRNGKLHQLTKDHSLLREMVELGQIKEIQPTDFLYKNIITKAIGTEPTVEPSIHVSDILQDDIFLLCSDGLSDMLSLHEIETIISSKNTLSETAFTLVEQAKEKGGHDNITVVLVRIKNHDLP